MVESIMRSGHTCGSGHLSRYKPPASPGKLVSAFNTWAFKRQQPSDLEQLIATAAFAQQSACPLPFVLYWGKGPRVAIGAAELQCLDFLASLGQRVADIHEPGTHFELLLTDTHAELNGHPCQQTRAYFEDVTAAATDRGFTTRLLSSVVAHSGVSTNTSNIAAPSHETLSGLEECAEKWYRGQGPAIDGAAAYFAMNMHEKRAVEICYPRAIFITFNSSALRVLFPDQMPIFYMYSLRKGCAIKPWFMDDEPVAGPPLTRTEYLPPALAAG